MFTIYSPSFSTSPSVYFFTGAFGGLLLCSIGLTRRESGERGGGGAGIYIYIYWAMFATFSSTFLPSYIYIYIYIYIMYAYRER